jgi:CBS domain-containing protein
MPIHDPLLSHIRVSDVMHTGILTTDASVPLQVVARLMSDQRVHAVAVADPDHARRPFGFVTCAAVVRAAAEASDPTAGEVATEVATVLSTDSLEGAAGKMVEHGTEHLVVIDEATGYASGILSALDIAAAYADF